MAGSPISLNFNFNFPIDATAILEQLALIQTNLETIMVDLTNAQAAMDEFKAEVAAHATKVDAELAQLLAASGSGDQAAVDAFAQSIRDETSALQAMDVKLDADDPAPTPPPAP
jgi:hypothetical protein